MWSPTSHRALIALDIVSTGGKSPFAVSLALGLVDEEGRVSDSFHSYVKVTASPPAGESYQRTSHSLPALARLPLPRLPPRAATPEPPRRHPRSRPPLSRLPLLS